MSLPTVVFMTALNLEFEAVASYLSNRTPPERGKNYVVGDYPKEKPRWRVVVVETGQTNVVAGIETASAFGKFKPDYLFFVGIAGGIKEVEVGDVVVAETVKDYEGGKIKGEQFLSRGEVGKSDSGLVKCANFIRSNSNAWCKKLQRDKPPKVFVPTTIVSGNKVLDSLTHELYQFIVKNYNDAVAVEMEGLGFLTAVYRCEGKGIVIRGISDLLAKTPDHDKKWQPIAAENAAAFAFAMLDDLNPTPHKEIDKTTSDDAIKPASSLIFKLDQAGRKGFYTLEAWFKNGDETPKQFDYLKNTGNDGFETKKLPSVIENILYKCKVDFLKENERLAAYRECFTVEFFLPIQLLINEPLERWLLPEIKKILGAEYRLVTRFCDYIPPMKVDKKHPLKVEKSQPPLWLSELQHICRKNQSVLNVLNKSNINWLEQFDPNNTDELYGSLCNNGKVFFILLFSLDKKSFPKLMRLGAPFIFWTRRWNDSEKECLRQEFEKLLNACKTLEELPGVLREKRFDIISYCKTNESSMICNVALLWNKYDEVFSFIHSKWAAPD